MENNYVMVSITASSIEKAAVMARVLVEERLAASVNMAPAVRSIYRWEGKIHDESEVLMFVKTSAKQFDALKTRILSLHEYSCPEIIALPIIAGHQPYLNWLNESVTK